MNKKIKKINTYIEQVKELNEVKLQIGGSTGRTTTIDDLITKNNEELRKYEIQVSTLDTGVVALNKNITKIFDDIDQLIIKINQLVREKNECISKNREANVRLLGSRSKLAKLEEARKKLIKDLTEKKGIDDQEKARLQREKNTLEQDIRAVQGEVGSTAEQVANLTRDNAAKDMEIARLTEEYNRENSKLKEYLGSTINKLKTNNEKFENIIKQLPTKELEKIERSVGNASEIINRTSASTTIPKSPTGVDESKGNS